MSYGKKYFDYQKEIGKFGGTANLFKFDRYIDSGDKVIDFGCGGGYLLENIVCKEKIGVEVNEEAVKVAKNKDIEVYREIEEVPNDWADVIISNHALEHVLNPFKVVKTLYKKLKKGGLIIFVVPCESVSVSYKEQDRNQHLYGWSPGALGNLFSKVGFNVKSSKPIYHKWPPFYKTIYKVFGKKLFNLVCSLYGVLDRSVVQVRIVASK